MNQRGEETAQLTGEKRTLRNGVHDFKAREETTDQLALCDTLVGRRRRREEVIMRLYPSYSEHNIAHTEIVITSCVKVGHVSGI